MTLTELLTAHSLIRSTSVEEFGEVVARAVCPVRMDPYPHASAGLMVYNSVDLGAVTLAYTQHGVPVRVRHDPMESTMLIWFSLAGSLTVRDGSSETRYDQHSAAIFNPDRAYDMVSSPGARALLLLVHRDAVLTELTRILGRPPARRLRFDASLDMSTPRARSWLSILRALCFDLDGPQGITHPVLLVPLQRLVITQLLTTLHHSASDEIVGQDSTAAARVHPRAIRRAEQLISEHCREPLLIRDIAEAVGISSRSLQIGFQKYLNTTPTERLRQARLTGARAELLASDPTLRTVSRVAANWGFGSHGRFSRQYRLAYGETPSQTLHR